jgi:RNA polymerase sigma factor (TIGR02999 family)
MSADTPQHEVTRLIQAASASDRAAADRLLVLVYDQLRKIAQQRMAEERAGHTLQATALVHEAYLRLVGDTDVHWQGRAHFFAAAAEAMRKILIDHARRKGTAKRGGGLRAVSSVLDLASDENISDALIIDDLISRLEMEDATAAQVVRLRFFAGLSLADTAKALGVSKPTVSRKWTYARAWLARQWETDGDRPAADKPTNPG